MEGVGCPFVEERNSWNGPDAGRRTGTRRLIDCLPTILVDARLPHGGADSARSWNDYAGALRGAAALIGEHVDNLTGDSDSGASDNREAVQVLSSAGVATIVTVSGRERDLVEATELGCRACAAGAVGLHCVTGDHPSALSDGRAAWFGTESMDMTASFAHLGLMVSVAESPASPGDRVGRLLDKQRAGATLCILNHSGPADALVSFADRARDAGVTLDLFAPVPLVADIETAHALDAFPGLVLAPGLTAAIRSAADPLAEGMRQAVAFATELRRSGRFGGCNLSGGSRHGDPLRRIEITRQFIDAVGSVW